MFMRPYGLWRTFYTSQFGRISGVDTNVVASAFSATWPDFLSPSGGNDPKVALEKALEWHFKSGILNSHDGSKGMSEAILSDDFGYRRGLRTDSHLLTGALFAAAGVKMNRPEWVKLGRNLVDFILAEGVQSPEGFYSWFSPREGRAGDEVYSSDMGRDALAMINMYKATGDVKYLESARKAADAFLMWMDGRGLNSGHFSNLSKGGWKVEGTNAHVPLLFEVLVLSACVLVPEGSVDGRRNAREAVARARIVTARNGKRGNVGIVGKTFHPVLCLKRQDKKQKQE